MSSSSIKLDKLSHMKITIPENWNEVLLSDYLEYWKRIKPYLNAEDEDLLNAVAVDTALTQICKVDFETLKSLDANDAMIVKTEVAKLLAQSTSIPLVRFFFSSTDLLRFTFLSIFR